MKGRYHQEITRQALGEYFQPEALETVILANLGQDALWYQFGHDHFHYDGNSFAAGDAYCEAQRRAVTAALLRGEAQPARTALGRLAHTVQDLYAHSNYVALWQESHPGAPEQEIDPEQTAILRDSRLHSGKLYYPLEGLYFFNALKPHVLPLLPRDSHAWMNLDDPSRPGFEAAFAAAVKRTRSEYLRLLEPLSAPAAALLCGKTV